MDAHVALFGADCLACHDGLNNILSDFDHTFPLDHGEEGQQACVVCHDQTSAPQMFADYSCYDCHEHEPDEIREEHVDEGIREFEDCVACHTTGLEDEADRDD